MSTMQPIRRKGDVIRLKEFFLEKEQYRNYLLIVMGMNIPMRISDLLNLRWDDVYDHEAKSYRDHIVHVEKKTGKTNILFLNHNVRTALEMYRKTVPAQKDHYLFVTRNVYDRPISRITAYSVIRKAGESLGLEHIGCHSLRKTFGYHAWKNGAHPAVIMSIYNHSSMNITKRYLGIEQDDIDEVFESIDL